MTRVEEQYPASIDNEELNSLLLTIRNQEQEIEKLHREVELMRNNIVKDTTGDFPIEEPAEEEKKKPVAKKKAASAAKKTATTRKKTTAAKKK